VISTAHDHGFTAARGAVDPERLRPLLNACLAERSAPASLRSLELANAWYRPGRDLTAVYRARLDGAAADGATHLLAVQRAFEARAARRVEKGKRRFEAETRAASALGQPFYHFPQIQMALWVFPSDPMLRSLPALLDPAAGRGLGLGVSPVVLRYVPSSRAVLRYDAAAGGEKSEAWPEAVICKVYRSEEALLRALRVLKDLRQRLHASSAPFQVPQPLHHDPDLRALWMSCVPGKPLGAPGTNLDAAAVARAGRGLAWLHRDAGSGRSVVEWEWTLTPEQELERVAQVCDFIRGLEPQFGPDLDRVHAALAAELPRLPPARPVLTHASFRLKHVLSDGESMHLIDSDNALRTDPLFDVAQFVTSLHDTEAQGILPAGRAAELEAAFLEGYAVESGRPVPAPALHWYAACLLLERRCWKHLKHLSPNAVPMIRRLLGQALRRIEMFHSEK
jgi:hypothetical protein